MDPPKLWKCLGDEMVFCVDLNTVEQAVGLLKAFRCATNNYRKPQSGIDLKNAAWIADFPVGSCEVHVRDLARGGAEAVDYIGTQMDLGFRLTHHASLRQFVISVDLALLVLDGTTDLSLFFEGRVSLKGVLGTKLYPLIWIDMLEKGDGTPEESLRGSSPKPIQLKKFSEGFITETNGQINRPYLKDDRHFNRLPAGWEKQYRAAKKLTNAEEEPTPSETPSGGNPPPSGTVKKLVRKTKEALETNVATQGKKKKLIRLFTK